MFQSDAYFTGKDEGLDVLVRKIIRECLVYMAREDRLQAQRDKAMSTVIKISTAPDIREMLGNRVSFHDDEKKMIIHSTPRVERMLNTRFEPGPHISILPPKSSAISRVAWPDRWERP